eukprot:14238968-Ditylum_brightwellii.AAC.1
MGLVKYNYAIGKKDPKKGKLPFLYIKDCLGLILMWTCTRGPVWVIDMMFGLTSSPMDCYICFGRCTLLFILQQEEQIYPYMPTQQEFESLVNIIGKKYNILAKKNVYCAIDGLKLYLQEADKVEIQE